MAKFFNERHEVLINTYHRVVGNTENIKSGQLVEHKHEVTEIKYYVPQNNEFGLPVFTKINLSKAMIVDLYNQIMEIESKCFNEAYSDDLF